MARDGASRGKGCAFGRDHFGTRWAYPRLGIGPAPEVSLGGCLHLASKAPIFGWRRDCAGHAGRTPMNTENRSDATLPGTAPGCAWARVVTGALVLGPIAGASAVVPSLWG